MERQKTKTKKRNLSTNTVMDHVDSFNAAADDREIIIDPPNHVPLTPSEKLFFDEVIAEFNKVDWTSHQLAIAAFLAREMYMMEKQQRLFRKEDAVLETANGNLTVNPRRGIINQCANSILSLRRSLALHARGVANTLDYAKNISRDRDIHKAAGEIYSDSENEDLLPRMNH